MRLLSLLSHTHALPTYAAPHRAFRAFSPTMVEVEEPEDPPPPAEPLPILLQTDSYIFVAKPAGTVVHRGKFTKKGEVPLMQRLRDQLGIMVNPVHRLDGGTSGCLLFAFDTPTTSMLQAAMQSADAKKTYYAFTRGEASWIQRHLEERPIKDDKKIVREARTLLHCVGSCEEDRDGDERARSSLVVATPSTGRWHQIRKHRQLVESAACANLRTAPKLPPWAI